MTIDDQIAALGAWRWKYQSDEEMTEPFEAIKKSLKRLKAIDTEAKAKSNPKFTYYQQFVEKYDNFCKFQSGAGAKMDAVQGKAMKQIITFLIAQSKLKDEHGALLAWEYILKNWNKTSDFIKRQIALTQINKNLPEILTQLKSYGKRNSKGSTAADDIRNAAG